MVISICDVGIIARPPPPTVPPLGADPIGVATGALGVTEPDPENGGNDG